MITRVCEEGVPCMCAVRDASLLEYRGGNASHMSVQ